MSSIAVRTQAELDKALADKFDVIDIVSEPGVWLTVTATGSATVTATDSATVRATGSATVTAYDSATVRAYDSATVTATDSATVRAYGSATVRAYGSATVTATGSATVTATDSATVRATDSATVRAYGSATVTATDSATVRAGSHVAVHLHSKRVTVEGGVVIDVTDLDLTDPPTWSAYKGLDAAGGKAVVYKAVDADLNAGHGWTLTAYPVGGTVTAPDWEAVHECGSGLHFSPDPLSALGYYTGRGAARHLACEIDLTESVPLGDKIKARSCRVLHEVDAAGRQVVAK